jgi:hypothetical protein
MPITFSLRSVAWLGLPTVERFEPHVSSPLAYPNEAWSEAHKAVVRKPTPENIMAHRHARASFLASANTDEIQYIVHGSPVVSRVSASKGDPDSACFFDRAGALLCITAALAAEPEFTAVSEVFDAFLTQHQAGSLR